MWTTMLVWTAAVVLLPTPRAVSHGSPQTIHVSLSFPPYTYRLSLSNSNTNEEFDP